MEAQFSLSVKDAISYSREEALRLKKDYIGTEHLLLGILKLDEGVRLLQPFKINVESLKIAIEKGTEDPKGTATDLKNLPLTKQAEKALKITYLEAKLSKAQIIDIDSLLLAILRDGESIVSQVLSRFGLDYDLLRASIPKIKEEIEVNEVKLESLELAEPQIEKARPLTLTFDLDEFSKEEIVEIISFLSDVYSLSGGDELEIVGTSYLSFKRVLELA